MYQSAPRPPCEPESFNHCQRTCACTGLGVCRMGVGVGVRTLGIRFGRPTCVVVAGNARPAPDSEHCLTLATTNWSMALLQHLCGSALHALKPHAHAPHHERRTACQGLHFSKMPSVHSSASSPAAAACGRCPCHHGGAVPWATRGAAAASAPPRAFVRWPPLAANQQQQEAAAQGAFSSALVCRATPSRSSNQDQPSTPRDTSAASSSAANNPSASRCAIAPRSRSGGSRLSRAALRAAPPSQKTPTRSSLRAAACPRSRRATFASLRAGRPSRFVHSAWERTCARAARRMRTADLAQLALPFLTCRTLPRCS